MALDYAALFILIAIVATLVYGLVAIWGIPYEIAKARSHPHQDAIGAATWVSLATLGALWPFLWIWAMSYRPDRGWGVSTGASSSTESDRVAQLESRLSAIERGQEKREE